jgi:hypothetical protein
MKEGMQMFSMAVETNDHHKLKLLAAQQTQKRNTTVTMSDLVNEAIKIHLKKYLND